MSETDLGGRGSFIGRDAEQRELATHWERAKGGRGGFVVVSGDPGIGKTELVDEFIRSLPEGSAMQVAWGSCPSADAPGLWPWRSILRTLDLGELIGDAVSSTDPAADRTRRHAAICGALVRIASTRPLLLVLDDLHWADADTVALLRLLVGELRHHPILVVATMRNDEPTTRRPDARELVSDAISGIGMIHLKGLGASEVDEMVTRLLDGPAPPEVVQSVADRSGGNPLFVRELARLIRVETPVGAGAVGETPALPPVFRDALLRRVRRLTDPTRRLLEIAAVAGAEVSVRVLASSADLSDQQVLARLADAVEEGLVETDQLNVRFDHDLVRDALAESLDVEDRRRLHLTVARMLEQEGGPGSEPSHLLGHYIAARPLTAAAEVAERVLRAARESIRRHAPADAVAQIERGLGALRGQTTPVTTDLHIELGRALAAVGRWDDSVEAHAAAVAMARADSDADGLARGALGQAGMMAHPRTDPELIDLLEEARSARLGVEDGLTVQVTARLAQALIHAPGQRQRCVELAEHAVELARRVAVDETLAPALYVWLIVHLESPEFESRLAVSNELLDIARRSGSPEIEAYALHLHAHHMAEAGQFSIFDADVAAEEFLARDVGAATWLWTSAVHRAMRATMRGDFVEGARLGDEAFALGVGAQHEVAGACYGAHLMALRTWQGRLGELLPMALSSAGQYRDLPAVWASIPYIRAETGATTEAGADLARLVEEGRLEHVQGAQSWSVAAAMLARAATLADRPELAGVLRDLLSPLGERHIVGPFADCYFGPVGLYRGLCAATVGDLDSATQELERAVVAAAEVGSRPVAAWAGAELSVVQLRAGAVAAAEERRHSCATSLRQLGMARHLERLQEQFERLRPGHAASVRTKDGRPDENYFVRTADGWSVGFRGVAIELRDTKGAADIHRLLGQPGREVHVLQLMAGEDGWLHTAPTQPVLDEKAKRDYRRRLDELDDDIDQATLRSDNEMVARARAEREMLVEHLESAVGLGGRTRHFSAEAERARQAVRARIRYALDRIEGKSPDLHAHLRSTIETGLFCCYRPGEPTTWRT